MWGEFDVLANDFAFEDAAFEGVEYVVVGADAAAADGASEVGVGDAEVVSGFSEADVDGFGVTVSAADGEHAECDFADCCEFEGHFGEWCAGEAVAPEFAFGFFVLLVGEDDLNDGAVAEHCLRILGENALLEFVDVEGGDILIGGEVVDFYLGSPPSVLVSEGEVVSFAEWDVDPLFLVADFFGVEGPFCVAFGVWGFTGDEGEIFAFAEWGDEADAELTEFAGGFDGVGDGCEGFGESGLAYTGSVVADGDEALSPVDFDGDFAGVGVEGVLDGFFDDFAEQRVCGC